MSTTISPPISPPPAPAPPPPAGVPPLPVRRFSVDEYHRMIEAGVLGEDDDVELLEGWITPKMPRSPRHDMTISIVHDDLFTPRLPADYFCRVQMAVSTADSEPEPDVSVVRGAKRDYRDRHPGPADMAQVTEVSESSLHRDRTIKLSIYARAGVPAYWIINLVDHQIEVHTSPIGVGTEGASYAERRVYRGEDLVPFAIDGRELGPIPARELLP